MGLQSTEVGATPGFPWLCPTPCESNPSEPGPFATLSSSPPIPLPLGCLHTSMSTSLSSAEVADMLSKDSALPWPSPLLHAVPPLAQGLTAASSLFRNLGPSPGRQGTCPGHWSTSVSQTLCEALCLLPCPSQSSPNCDVGIVIPI